MDKVKLKESDKLLCKKDIDFFEKGNYYSIIKIEQKSNTYIHVSKDEQLHKWFIMIHGGGYYIGRGYFNNIWEFFYSPQEVRKLKLDKIHEK